MRNDKRVKRFMRRVKAELLRLFVYSLVIFAACFAACLILSLPEIIGLLIFG